MLDFPRDEHHCHHPYRNRKGKITDPDVLFEQEVLRYFEQDASTLLMLRALFDQFSTAGKGAIAAAGNDAYDSDSAHHVRPKARYPAALNEVTGVGALSNPLEIVDIGNGQRKLRTSKFSNVADEPGIKGIVTLGGEAGEGKGILGLYIGEFPDGRRNTSKWAWWAGTSFATPIITATVASVLSSPAAISTTQAALRELYNTDIVKNEQTEALEDALATTQC
jgi:subtilisin family serine protease